MERAAKLLCTGSDALAADLELLSEAEPYSTMNVKLP